MDALSQMEKMAAKTPDLKSAVENKDREIERLKGALQQSEKENHVS